MKFLIILALALSSCMPRTTVLKIYYGGEAPVTDEQIAPMEKQIDAAAMAAAVLVGLSPHAVFDETTFFVTFADGPIEYHGKLYAGLSSNETIRAMLTPKCLFDPGSALLHEFVHQMFGWAQNGDMDTDHAQPHWQIVPHLRQKLAERYCPEQFPAFMPDQADEF